MQFKIYFRRSIPLLLLSTIFPFLVTAQSYFFKEAAETQLKTTTQKRLIVPEKYRALQLDTSTLLSFLKKLPFERAAILNRKTTPVIELPMPDGTIAQFHIWESSTMAPELAARYPNLRTFTGQGITDSTATLKLDWTELGFHAQILSPVTTAIYIDPYAQGTLTGYISYYKKDLKKKGSYTELPPIPIPGSANRVEQTESTQCIGTQLRTYRLAVACTGEYAVAATGVSAPTKAQALSAIVTTVNRVDGIYEMELALRMVLVATEDSVVYTNATTDPFTGNSNASTLISESQTVIDNRIGTANYDMGHTFSTGGGGLSGLGIICKAGQKARSITGSPSPTGDGYDVDYVAHEMGHAVGANHTFNSKLGSCSGNGVSSTNTEPGSGTTIMAYAGICLADDIQPHSDPQFHAASLDEISTYTFLSTGNTCGTLTSTGNTPPVVNAGANYIIPKSTPFILTGSATDANGDALTYSWEEIDKGGAYGAANAPTGNAPLFRSFIPVTTPTRYFPKLSDVINNTNTIGEILPSYARTVRFRLTARDNRAAGGGVCFDSTSLIVDGTAAPFVVTAPTATGTVWPVNDFKTVTWDASTTAAAPINCANVTVQLSTDGGNTFPITLLASTPNDGSEEIQVPNNINTTARIRVMALGNVFYDMSNNNFTIQASPTADFAFNNPATEVTCGADPSILLKTGSLGGFANAVTLSASGVPAGTTITFGSNPVLPGNNTTVTLNNANTLTAGSYSIDITGVASGAASKTRTITFVVRGTLPPPTPNTPASNAIGISTTPFFTWAAVAGALSYTLEISTASDFAAITQTFTGISTTSYTLTTQLADNTVYYWRVKTVNSCGTGSASTIFLFKTLLTICNSSFSQDFITTTFPPANLTIFNPNSNVTWTRDAAGNGTAGSAFIDNFNNNTLNQIDDIRTQPYTPGSIDSVIISFDVAHKYYSATDADTLRVLVSSDNGTTFTALYSKAGAALATAGLSTTAYTAPNASDWRRERIAIGGTYLTAGPLIFAFRNINDYGNNIFIDNISICSQTAIPITSSITDYFRTKASGNWNAPGTWESAADAGFTRLISPATLTPDSSAKAITVLNTHTITVTSNVITDQLTIDNGGAITVSSGDTLTISDGAGFDLTVNGITTVQSGGNILLRSTALGTAAIGNSAGSVTGNITVQRYIPSRRAWRLMTSPLSNTNTIYQAWQNSGVNTVGTGTFITGPIGNGLDNGNTYSLKSYNIATGLLENVTNTNVSLSAAAGSAANIGYFLFVRGDRNPLNLTPPNTNVTTLSSTGALQTGTQAFTVPSAAAGNFILVGNPYASPVDFNLIGRTTNIPKRFYAWDPQLNAVGGYITLDDTDNGDGVYTISPSSPGGLTNIIQSSQAFFVQAATAGTATVTFNESNKSSVTTNAGFRTNNGLSEVLRTSLYLKNVDNSATLADGVVAEYGNNFSAAVGFEDADKMANINENLAMQRDAHLLSIERRPLVDGNDTLYLNLTNTTPRDYRFTFEPSNFSALVSARLEDTYLNTSTPVSITAPTSFDFSITSDAASFSPNRFRIVFKTSSVLPITFTGIKAAQKNAGIQVDWNIATESNINRYEVEKSADGVQFVKANETAAKANNNSAVSYNWYDASPFSGNNYYRIKVISSNTSAIRYSQVVNVKTGNGKSSILIYPNPVKDRTISVQLSNQPSGKYLVQLFNALGQQMLTKTIEHTGGSATQTIQLGTIISKGVYQVHVTNGENKINQQVIVE